MALAGFIDRVTPSGFVEGWARREESPEPVWVDVMLGEECVARGVAELFRKDLAEEGVGHAHHAFVARLRRPLPAGPTDLSLRETETLAPITPVPITIQTPRVTLGRRLRVEDLLSHGVQWSDEDVLNMTEAMNLEGSFRRMGAKRFVDAVFHFVLGRAADANGIAGYAPGLLSGHLAPIDVLKDVLGSEERRNRGGALPSPHDNGYPFGEVSSPADLDVAAGPG